MAIKGRCHETLIWNMRNRHTRERKKYCVSIQLATQGKVWHTVMYDQSEKESNIFVSKYHFSWYMPIFLARIVSWLKYFFFSIVWHYALSMAALIIFWNFECTRCARFPFCHLLFCRYFLCSPLYRDLPKGGLENHHSRRPATGGKPKKM